MTKLRKVLGALALITLVLGLTASSAGAFDTPPLPTTPDPPIVNQPDQVVRHDVVEHIRRDRRLDRWLRLVRGIEAAWQMHLASGAMACPVPASSFIDSWHAPRVGHLHQGVDMMAPDGTPIYAPTSGTYEQHGSESFYLHGDNGTTYFGTHLQEHVAPSGPVEAGQVIALVGHTGNASPGAPHLHFEIHPGGGGAVNPYPTTAAACS